ncbi:MAG: hypothetical protein N2234_03690 [Planctomycetota bacterium]|nr:hypothetical protein [Planctomycetota bacterium]
MRGSLVFFIVLFLSLLLGCGKEHPVPRVEITTPTSPKAGDAVIISYILYDLEGRLATLEVEYSIDGLTWKNATEGAGGDGKTNLSSAGRGKAHSFVWNSVADLGYANYDAVYIRMRPTTKRTGDWAKSGSFSIQNHPLGKWSSNIYIGEGYEPALAVFETIASSRIYVVFTRSDSGDKNVYIAVSTDGGNSFEKTEKVPEATIGANQHRPSVTVASSGTFYIVYQENTATDSSVWCVSGTYDSGNKTFTFGPPLQVDDDTTGAYRSESPKVVAAGTTVIVVWQNLSSGNWSVVMDVDNGSGFGTDTVVSDAVVTQAPEPVDTLNLGVSELYIFWNRYNGSDYDVYCDHSNSSNWRAFGTDIRVDKDTGTANAQRVAASAGSSRFFALFEDSRNATTSGLDIVLCFGDASGFSESTLSSDAGEQTSPVVVATDDNTLFGFYLHSDGLYCRKGVYSLGSWTYESVERVDDAGGSAAKSKADVALYAGVPVAVFGDNRSGTSAVYLTKRSM